MQLTACEERDRLILAFALALNEQNDAWDKLEIARSEPERTVARDSIATAKGNCHDLRSALLVHCNQHGC
jgi:hypothetical protein